MPDRLLAISYAFPPVAVPEAVLAAKALHALEGFEIDLVCAAPMSWHGQDESFLTYAEERLHRVVRLDVPRWLPAVQPHRVLRRYPDAMRFLRGRARQAVAELHPERYAAVLTWSQWHSVHLVGLDLVAAHPDLAWMAHFSDPWVDNPLVPLDPIARRVARRMERAVLARADASVFTAEPARRRTMARHPETWSARSHVVPHLFDEALYGDAGGSLRSDDLVVRYLGTFYGERRPDPLVAALEWLLAHTPEVLAGVRVELVGSVAPDMRRPLERSALPAGLLSVVDRVDYRRSLQLMRESDVLVAIDAPSDESVFLASKVVDYLGAARPIVALVPPGAAADVVSAAGGWVASPGDAAAAAAALAAALVVARRRVSSWGEAAVRDRFRAEAVGARRADILRRIVASPSRPGRRLRSGSEPQT